MNRVSIKKSVPEIYVKESRDFQLLCDLFDLVNSGVKFDIDTITHLSDTQLCRDSMLRFLQEKLGLSFRNSVTDETLRRILKCFPFIIRNKGTRRGIAEMVSLFLNIVYSDGSYEIVIENTNDNSNLETMGLGNYVIAIITSVEDACLKELDILDDLLKYVIPTGYKIDYSLNMGVVPFKSTTLSDSTVYVTVFDERKENRIRSSEDKTSYEKESMRNNLHSIGAIVVRASAINDDDVNEEMKGHTFKEFTTSKEEMTE